MSFYVKLRYVLKVLSAAAWVVILPVTYAYTWKKNPPGFAQTIKSWFGNNSSSPSLFIMAVVLYLAPNILAALLFLFPFIRRVLERSNYKIVMLTMWWAQVYTINFCRYMSNDRKIWDINATFIKISGSLDSMLEEGCMKAHFLYSSKESKAEPFRLYNIT